MDYPDLSALCSKPLETVYFVVRNVPCPDPGQQPFHEYMHLEPSGYCTWGGYPGAVSFRSEEEAQTFANELNQLYGFAWCNVELDFPELKWSPSLPVDEAFL